MCESFKSLGLLLHTNPEQEQEEEQERDPFLGGLRHAKNNKCRLGNCLSDLEFTYI